MTSPDRVRPDSTQVATSVGPYYQNANNAAIGAAKNQWMKDGAENVRENLFFKLLSGFPNVAGVVGDGIAAIIEAITGVHGGDLGDLDLWSSGMADELQNQQDSLQVLEGIRARGVAYIPSSLEESFSSSFTRARFSSSVGPVIGMTFSPSTYEFVLSSRGAYEVSTRMQFSWVTFTDRRVWCDIVVRAPNGSEFHRAPFVTKTPDVEWIGPIPKTDNYQTISHITNFIVPAAGYRVSIEAKAASTRGILTGYGLTEFTVNKWSSETS
ncbi:hypothetical protein JVX90_00345 [Gordonia sp. PDNC005]|uniref:hypothetical protein n=1 Tax=Gordonia sp. PDNC005 TaxID=2811424 RepID=UPI00196685CD|nr:hypothetical protein [Gordonia sp. PDNC005]QRY62762.1 hypothetical protein JVX90_00345 [Gordonia sp. PDNC005]